MNNFKYILEEVLAEKSPGGKRRVGGPGARTGFAKTSKKNPEGRAAIQDVKNKRKEKEQAEIERHKVQISNKKIRDREMQIIAKERRVKK